MSSELTQKTINSALKSEQASTKPVLSNTVFVENVTKLKNHFDEIENYRKDLVKKQNVILWNLLRVYKNSSRKFNLNKISDFYMINTKFSLDYLLLIKKVIKKINQRLIVKKD